MESFLEKFGDHVIGVLNGFDRLVFRGTLRRIVFVRGMMSYLFAANILLKDFSRHVSSVSSHLKDTSLAAASRASRPVQYLASSGTLKQKVAQRIAEKDRIREGLVCILKSVEPCMSYDVYRNRETKRLELVTRRRKCLHLYHYYVHPVFGFMNVRIQTWFPFNIQVCINGREWLSRQMDKAGMAYQRRDNCFTWLEDTKKAQDLMNQQLRACWPDLLKEIALTINPAQEEIFKDFPSDYYWSVFQSEWASDIMFRSPDDLAKIYPSLVYHAVATFSSPDVMRFLGRKIPADGKIPHAFAGEVVTDLKQRPEGVRVKHRVKSNSIKLYDKQGKILRPETTINDPSDFKVYRRKESDKNGLLAWLPLRKGIADLHRRAQVSQASNNRYLEALASAESTTPLKTWTDKLCRPVTWNGKRVRALNPYSPQDASLLEAISRGEFTINGFRNRDLRNLLYHDKTPSDSDKRRHSAIVTRKIRLLRAHGLVSKVSNTHRYILTKKGRIAVTALLTARNADTASLTKLVP